jgi:hypothetical protein
MVSVLNHITTAFLFQVNDPETHWNHEPVAAWRHDADNSPQSIQTRNVTPKGVQPPALCHASATREGP